MTTALGAPPYSITRMGVLMEPNRDDPYEVEGVLNPASGRDPEGRLFLLPRIVAAGNVSRVGLAEVLVEGGVPVGVGRRGVALAPDAGWERAARHSGVEDPRVTFVPSLGVHLMAYVAFGPLGPRPALAVSTDLRSWRRLGPLHFEYDEALDTDLNLYPNKDVVFFPEPVPGPGGEPSYAALHRPMWDLDWIFPGAGMPLPAGLTDPRPGIWISYVPVAAVFPASGTDLATPSVPHLSALTHLSGHRLVALPEQDFEVLKIGAGPPPIRIPEGWLLIHHGVSGELVPGLILQPNAHYAAGAMILSADDPGVVLSRSPSPLLAPEIYQERHGVVPNVVFPTAVENVDGRQFIFYGMADSRIGVAELTRHAEIPNNAQPPRNGVTE